MAGMKLSKMSMQVLNMHEMGWKGGGWFNYLIK